MKLFESVWEGFIGAVSSHVILIIFFVIGALVGGNVGEVIAYVGVGIFILATLGGILSPLFGRSPPEL